MDMYWGASAAQDPSCGSIVEEVVEETNVKKDIGEAAAQDQVLVSQEEEKVEEADLLQLGTNAEVEVEDQGSTQAKVEGTEGMGQEVQDVVDLREKDEKKDLKGTDGTVLSGELQEDKDTEAVQKSRSVTLQRQVGNVLEIAGAV